MGGHTAYNKLKFEMIILVLGGGWLGGFSGVGLASERGFGVEPPPCTQGQSGFKSKWVGGPRKNAPWVNK